MDTFQLSNIFRNIDTATAGKEVFEIIHSGKVKIERIISTGQTTPEGQWYDQEADEFVILLSGEAHIQFEGHQVTSLTEGDYLFIPAHARHRVTFTSQKPSCLWLAFHGEL